MLKSKPIVLAVLAVALTAGTAGAANWRTVYKSLSPDKQQQIRTLNLQRRNELLKAYQARVASVQGKAGDVSAMSSARSGFAADRQSVNKKYLDQAKTIINAK